MGHTALAVLTVAIIVLICLAVIEALSRGATLAAIAQQMRNGNTYANVHSVANPGGVIRGQIAPAGD